MSERGKLALALLGLLLLCGATYLLVKNNEGKVGVIDQTTRVAYASQHGFTFNYDAVYALVELSDRYIHIERAGAEPNELVSINIESPYEDTAYEDFQDFLYERAILYCAADGPTASIRCTRTSRTQEFTTETGISGEVFYLELEHATREGTSVREAGPFWGFDITRGAATTTALIIFPTHFFSESELFDEGAEEANDIVNSLEFTSTQ